MDPTTCLREILHLLDASNCIDEGFHRQASREDAIDRLEALTEWLKRGGFSPDVVEAIQECGVLND